MPVSLGLGLLPPELPASQIQPLGPNPGKGAPVCQGEGRVWVTTEGLQGRCGQMIPVLTVQVNGKTRPLTSNTTHEAKRLNRIGRIPPTSPCSWLQAIATCPILPRHREVTVQIAGVLGEELVSATSRPSALTCPASQDGVGGGAWERKWWSWSLNCPTSTDFLPRIPRRDPSPRPLPVPEHPGGTSGSATGYRLSPR